MTTHVLKTWPQYFERVLSGEKTFDIRRDDRGYQTGDRLVLKEWDPDHEKPGGGKFDPPTRYTGRELTFRISYIYRHTPGWLDCGEYAVLGIQPYPESADASARAAAEDKVVEHEATIQRLRDLVDELRKQNEVLVRTLGGQCLVTSGDGQ